jgi:hypothetical protein
VLVSKEVANRHLEQISFLWRQVSTFGEEIIWHFTRFQKLEESRHDSGLRERITSPVAGSRRMYTSEPSKRYSAGRRTAWLRPFRKSFAVTDIASLVVYIMVYTISMSRLIAITYCVPIHRSHLGQSHPNVPAVSKPYTSPSTTSLIVIPQG